MRERDDDVKSGYTTNSMMHDVTFCKVIKCKAAKPSDTWIYNKATNRTGLTQANSGREIVKTPFRSSPLIYRLLLWFHFLHLFTLAAGDYYSGYMAAIITNHTASACEGQVLYIRCPLMSTIDIKSAMFGRKVPSVDMCPPQTSIWGSFSYLRSKENTDCEAVTSFAKTAADCHGRRYCGLLVHSRVFGDDPCPGTTKYLSVTYKCKLMPDEFKERGSCDDETMVVRCAKVNYVIAVYNVTLTKKEGCRKTIGSNCTLNSESALDEVTASCHKRQRCTIRVAHRDCANYMHLEYACIPKRILTDRLPSSVLSASSDEPEENPFLSTTTELLTSTTSAPSKAVHPSIRVVTTSTSSAVSTTTEVASSTLTSTEVELNVTETKQTDTSSEVSQITTTTTSKPPKVTFTSTTTKSSKSPHKKGRKSTHTPFVFHNHFATTTAHKQSAEDEGSNPGQMNTSSSIPPTEVATTTTTPMVVEGNTSATTSAFPFLRSIVALATYIRENKDQVLIVFLGCLCIGLFLTVCMLICKLEEKNLLRWRKKKKKADQNNRSGGNEGTESASLLGAAARQSQTGSSTASPGNVYSAPTSRSNSNGRVNHIEYMLSEEQRRRKQRSRMRSLMNKWCSCCCRNAPWQRDQQSDDYQIEHRSTSLSDDDAISAVASGRSHFDVEPQPIFAATSPDSPQREEVVDAAPRFNAFPNAERLSDEIPYADDDTSEYDYHDNDVTPPKPEPTAVRPTTLHPNLAKFSPSTAHSSSTFVNPAQNVQPINRNPYLQRQQMPIRQSFTQPHQVAREPPPFPKHSTYGYQVPPQSVPHYATQQRVPYNTNYQQQQPQRIRTNPMTTYHTQQRHPASFTSSFNEHYVSLQPQHHPASSARTLSLGQPESRLERRGSWYDNSRESPMYEYFQRQGRQELPGTKNLNQYY
uniref:Uncharacterized protein LOC100184301 n=1 Tax=Phallusia mammillata TaxID=59560 RepID=A0A6F9DHD5_9ASCI|nr:uncharacterized protein LOC100184301 [Phallusia mammillata]